MLPSLLGVGKALLLSARPKQWTKNLIIYFALFFSINEAWQLGNAEQALTHFARTTAAFALFAALSSAVYLVNDVSDAPMDRRHPRKRFRPIASGQLSPKVALTAAIVLTALGLAFSFVLEPLFGLVAVVYAGVMFAYSLVLKRIVLLDVLSISGGFVLRAVAGAAVLAVPISPWLYTCTGVGALLLALGKRRSEIAQAGEAASRQRDTLRWYTREMTDQFIAIAAPSTLLAYTLYTFTAPNLPENHAMMLTILFVLYGLFRYVYIIHTRDLGESPEEILITDIPLIICILSWLVTAATVLVVFR